MMSFFEVKNMKRYHCLIAQFIAKRLCSIHLKKKLTIFIIENVFTSANCRYLFTINVRTFIIGDVIKLKEMEKYANNYGSIRT